MSLTNYLALLRSGHPAMILNPAEEDQNEECKVC